MLLNSCQPKSDWTVEFFWEYENKEFTSMFCKEVAFNKNLSFHHSNKTITYGKWDR